LTYYFINWNAN